VTRVPNASAFDFFPLYTWFVAQLAMGTIFRKALAAPKPSAIAQYWSVIVPSLVGSLVLLAGWHWMGRPYAALGLGLPISRAGLFGLLFDGALLGFFVYALFFRTISPERAAVLRKPRTGREVLPETAGALALYSVAGTAGAVCEELLLRGFLFWLLMPVIGLCGALLVSSVLFGLGHAYQGAPAILHTTIEGLALGAGYALTHSLWWLMVAHAFVNLYVGLFAFRLVRLTAASADITAPENHGMMR
jgi:hypothetical protein